MSRATPAAALNAAGVRSAYRRIAPLYDLWGRLTESRAQDRCVRWIGAEPGALVVDVATGTGTLPLRILRSAPEAKLIGVDLTDAMLAVATAKTAPYRDRCLLAQADARRLPLAGASADVLCSSYLFDLLPESDFGVVLAEFRRVLKPGGRLLLSNMTRPGSPLQGFWELLYRIHPPMLGGCRGVLMEPHVTAAGFRVLRRDRLSQFAFPSELILARSPASTDL